MSVIVGTLLMVGFIGRDLAFEECLSYIAVLQVFSARERCDRISPHRLKDFQCPWFTAAMVVGSHCFCSLTLFH
ncbi:hypothetical protein NPIL_92731 [Nephila pilipes]|uniref:Secreted protein n=1 Tax=Nephila pilipes TaxID=299642 RepID=A0A8X6P9W0_NEPPI|nr:hypothetical protein NPIL_92731 [Nephila pilipes]